MHDLVLYQSRKLLFCKLFITGIITIQYDITVQIRYKPFIVYVPKKASLFSTGSENRVEKVKLFA